MADEAETWVERRTSSKQVAQDPYTLNEIGLPRPLVYIPPGEWEKVEERNPRLKGMRNVETMCGGFELDPEDLNSFVRPHFLWRGLGSRG